MRLAGRLITKSGGKMSLITNIESLSVFPLVSFIKNIIKSDPKMEKKKDI